jgi:transcriptional regulator with XRE-family HTH domain
MPCANRPLHRLALVREQQGITRRTVARRLNVDLAAVKAEEQPHCDISLSRVYQWQAVLEVPVADLLVEPEESLSAPVMQRARMVRIMKTAQALLERTHEVSIRRMAQVLVDQLVEIMPELESVSPWHIIGRRRTQDEVGQAGLRSLSADGLRDLG